jgi:hypothetical protein
VKRTGAETGGMALLCPRSEILAGQKSSKLARSATEIEQVYVGTCHARQAFSSFIRSKVLLARIPWSCTDVRDHEW